MFEFEHYVSRRFDLAVALTCYGLGAWVRKKISSDRHRDSNFHLSGDDRGHGSNWVYDGGALVGKSILLGKPVILVTFK